jgi:hypothetical protein
VVAAIGVAWYIGTDRVARFHVIFAFLRNYPSYRTLFHLFELGRDRLIPGTYMFCINAETEREFCTRNDLTIGGAAVMMWCQYGRSIVFRRPGWRDRDSVVGFFNREFLNDLIQSVISGLLQEGPETKQESKVLVSLNF